MEVFSTPVSLCVMGLEKACQTHTEKVGFAPSTLVVSPHNHELALEVKDCCQMHQLRIQVLWGIPAQMWYVASPEFVVVGNNGDF